MGGERTLLNSHGDYKEHDKQCCSGRDFRPPNGS